MEVYLTQYPNIPFDLLKAQMDVIGEVHVRETPVAIHEGI
jgi:hypothetical protein